jgi:hypothetical protein
LEATGLRLGADAIYHGWGGFRILPHSLQTNVGIEGVLGTFRKIAREVTISLFMSVGPSSFISVRMEQHGCN